MILEGDLRSDGEKLLSPLLSGGGDIELLFYRTGGRAGQDALLEKHNLRVAFS